MDCGRVGGRSRRGRRGGGRASGAALRGREGRRSAPGRTSRHGPGRARSPSCPPGWRPATPWTTRPRRSCSTSCGARAPTGWPAWSPGPGIRCWGCGATRPMRCVRPWALVPVHDPSNDDPAFLRNRVRHELLPLCADVAGRDPVPAAGPPGRRPARRGALLNVLAPRPLPDPEDAAGAGRRCRSPWPGGRSPMAPGVGPGPTSRGLAYRRRWPRWSGCWRWPPGRRWPPRSRAAGGCAARAGRLSVGGGRSLG